MFCQKCGKELQEGALVCGYCGAAIPRNQLSQKTLQTIEANKNSDESLKPNHYARIRIFGIILMIVSGIVDIASMVMISTSSYASFNTLTIFGTIAFFIGMILTFAFHG